MSCWSFPGTDMVTPVGLAMSNRLITLRHMPIFTKPPYIVLLITAIGGWTTLGKKLKISQTKIQVKRLRISTKDYVFLSIKI